MAYQEMMSRHARAGRRHSSVEGRKNTNQKGRNKKAARRQGGTVAMAPFEFD
jgi:hypothetical protein